MSVGPRKEAKMQENWESYMPNKASSTNSYRDKTNKENYKEFQYNGVELMYIQYRIKPITTKGSKETQKH